MNKTLSFKQFLKKYYGYKNANDMYAKMLKKKVPDGTILAVKEEIEEQYCKYCNTVHKKYSPLWY